ncbi:MAG: lycopene beta-cyclase CrtY [Hyphomicrobiaceae bacterium]|nr:lycopene beta-cyclase CrtY [Hyphomicrobiaceae bacterium]
MDHFDVILVGGGLANMLIAIRLATTRRDLRILIAEAKGRIGGDHTWSYHSKDVTPCQDLWLSSIGNATWPSQLVQFPSYKRTLATGYRTLTSDDLRRRLANYSVEIILSTRVNNITNNSITLDGGQKIFGTCVIDGRGIQSFTNLKLGYQKFFGIEFEMFEPHYLSEPIIMDSVVDQTDGYRFIYSLPYSPTSILIEDTYYSPNSSLNRDRIANSLYYYAQSKGWKIKAVKREETGVLPVVIDGKFESIWPSNESTPRSGIRAGFFHNTTGYSLPFSAAAAQNLASIEVLNSSNASVYLRAEAQKFWNKQHYFQLLNRMLFVAARNDEHRGIFQRFYRLPRPLIERFYAAELNIWDKFQILYGKPPVSICRAMSVVLSCRTSNKKKINLSVK